MNTNKRSEAYSSPELEVMDITSEGVLCASNGVTEDGGMLPE